MRVRKKNRLRTERIAVMVVLLLRGAMPTSLPVAQATPIFLGSSLSDLKEFPEEVQDVMGYAIYKAQVGEKHPSAKPLTGDPAFRGAGVLEVVDKFDGNAFRVVYTVRFSTVVYVLHAFQKKANAGISTPLSEIRRIKARLKMARDHYQQNFPEQEAG